MLSICQEAEGCAHCVLLSQWQEGLWAMEGHWVSGAKHEVTPSLSLYRGRKVAKNLRSASAVTQGILLILP